ncbi:MAG: GAF domain-containing sensor histidine kinase [Phycisphaerae bacterium]|nr:GAF domain-containing sensor histidine kinase [Phycisphaerae bacterium]
MADSLEKTPEKTVTQAKRDQPGRYGPVSGGAADQLRAVLAISRALAGKLDVQQILPAALSAVAEIAGAEGSSIMLIDPETKAMSFFVAAGPGAEAAKAVRLPPGEGICGHVARTGKSLIVNDPAHHDHHYGQVDQSTGITTRNLVCVPLSTGKRLWGVIELINKRTGEDFEDRDLQLVETVAPQIALALENAHLHDEIVQGERMAAVGRTVSGLAHCIKNILNGIKSGSAVVNRAVNAQDFEKTCQGWQVVNKNNEMLSRLVLDMLSLAREAKFHPFPTDVNDLAEQICALVADRAGERNISISCTPAGNLPEVTCDPTQLYRCLLNLISNAIEAGRDGSRVRVRVYRSDRKPRFTISVADDGTGISGENRDRIFSEFFTTKGSRGTGLGLPVTKKLIVAMGGTITFHSVAGRGTKFVVALPTHDDPAADKETSS